MVTHTSAVKNVVFSDDGRRLTSLGNNEVKVYDLAGKREVTSVRSGADSDSKGPAETGAMDQVATALSPNGKLAALGGGYTYKNGVLGFGGGLRTRPLRVVDVATGREVESFKLAGDLSSPTDLTFSPDSRLLVAKFVELGARDASMRSWLSVFDVASGRELKKLPSTDALGMGGIAFSPDGKLLASRVNAVSDSALAGSLNLIDTGTWREVRSLAKTGFGMSLGLGDRRATPLSFSRDGRWVAASLGDGVGLFDTATGERIQNLRTRQRVSAVTPGGNSQQATANEAMAQAGFDPDMMREIRESVSDMTGAGGLLGRLTGLSSSALSFSPDGRLLTASSPHVVWDLVAGAPQPPNQEVPANPTIADVLGMGATPAAYSADGKLSATVGGDENGSFAIVVKDVKTDEVVRRIPVGTAATGSKKQKVSGPSGQPFEIPDAMMRQLQISGLAFSAKGLVVHYCETDFGKGGGMAMFGGGGGGKQECHAVTTDPASGKQLRDLKLDGPKNTFGGMSSASVMSPDGRFLVSVEMSGFGGGGKFGLSLPGMGRGGGSAARPSYTVTATDLETGKRVWETKTGSESLIRPPSVGFSPNGAQLALVTSDKDQTAIKVFDTATRRELSTLATAGPNVQGMVFSRDGKRLALTYGAAEGLTAMGSNRDVAKANRAEPVVTIHDLATGRRAATLKDDAPIVGVAFDTTGRLVATLGEDGNQDLWDAQTGERVATLVNLIELGSFGATEWLVVTPEGLFDGSPGAWQQIMWRFSENTFDVGPVEIFFNELYYPSLLSDIIAGKRPKAPRSLPQIDRRQPDLHVTLESPAGGEVASRTVAVSIDVAELPAGRAAPAGQRRAGRPTVSQRHAGQGVARRRAEGAAAGSPAGDAAHRRRPQSHHGVRVQPRQREERGRVRRGQRQRAAGAEGRVVRARVRRQRVRQSAVQPEVRAARCRRVRGRGPGAGGEARRLRARRGGVPARPARHQGEFPGGPEPPGDGRGRARGRRAGIGTAAAGAARGRRHDLLRRSRDGERAALLSGAARSRLCRSARERRRRERRGDSVAQRVGSRDRGCRRRPRLQPGASGDRRLQLRPGARSRGAPPGADELEGARAAGLREGHVHPHGGPELSGGARDRAAGPRLPDLRARRRGVQEGPGGSTGEGRRDHGARMVRLRDRSRAADAGCVGRIEAPAAAGRQGRGSERRAQSAATARVLSPGSGAAPGDRGAVRDRTREGHR